MKDKTKKEPVPGPKKPSYKPTANTTKLKMISNFSFCFTPEGPLFVIKNIAALINKIGMTDSRVSFEILLTSNVPIEDPVNANTTVSYTHLTLPTIYSV